MKQNRAKAKIYFLHLWDKNENTICELKNFLKTFKVLGGRFFSNCWKAKNVFVNKIYHSVFLNKKQNMSTVNIRV